MPVDLTKKMADHTWEIRLKMDDLVKAGIPEEEAIVEIMELEPHRNTKLKVWRERGLWPITDAEREARTSDNALPSGEAFDSSVCPGGDDSICSGNPDSLHSLSPEEVPQDILAAVRVTVNAAIMDYHNVQIVQLQDKIASLQERIDHLEQGQRDPRSFATEEFPAHRSTDTTFVAMDRTQSFPLAVRELVEPPQPRTVFGSREQVASQAEITAKCDSALMEMFERDREERGFDRDRMMDFVLYNFYDRPALSFQFTKRDK